MSLTVAAEPGPEGQMVRSQDRWAAALVGAACVPAWDPEDGCVPSASSVLSREPLADPGSTTGPRGATGSLWVASAAWFGCRVPQASWPCVASPISLIPEHIACRGIGSLSCSRRPPLPHAGAGPEATTAQPHPKGWQVPSSSAERLLCHWWRARWGIVPGPRS